MKVELDEKELRQAILEYLKRKGMVPAKLTEKPEFWYTRDNNRVYMARMEFEFIEPKEVPDGNHKSDNATHQAGADPATGLPAGSSPIFSC